MSTTNVSETDNSNLSTPSIVPSTVSPTAPTALIIDDNQYNREIVRVALESQGFDVTDYEDSVAAVSLLNERTFDLLVLDMQMPVLGGQQVLTIIKSNVLHKAMQIIILTAHSQMDTSEVQNNANYIMYKPISVTSFAQFAHRLQSVHSKASSKEAN